MRFWTTMQTRQGWSWTCTHPECERAEEQGGYGSRMPTQTAADRAAQLHIIRVHGGVS